MKNVLIVEDERLMQDLLYEYFTGAGYMVHTASDGVEALTKFRNNNIHLVILDIMMPKLDGFSVCRKIRKESDALIIMLTAREDEDDKLLGYELGADDYVTKPFSPKVLLAKANSLLHRFDNHKEIEKKTKSNRLVFKDMVIETDGFNVKIADEEITLTKKEFDILCILAVDEGKAISRDQILNKIWGEDYFGDGRVLDTHIKTLRKKLGAKSNWIKTVINIGYKFEVK